MRINKHDTQGTKPLLNKGELGYDDYTAGGDTGRVYVGTGTENVAISKKSELDLHTNNTNNPHGVTKAQVGLNLVDNTADANKNVLSATKLTTPRNIALTGDVTGNVNFDGSANVSITTTVAANSVALGVDTTGNYMANVVAGTGISVAHTQGEGSTATITNSAPNVTTDISITHNASNIVVNSSDGLDGTVNAASQTLAGVMSAADKTKLDGIASGATTNTGTVTSIATSGAITGGTITSSGTISHSTADGFLHVPATGTTNNGKVLTAGATAGSLSWTSIPSAPVSSVVGLTGAITTANVFDAIKTVDGAGSGLDADLLDGMNSSSSNTASTIVARDASGNFTAGTITANLTGNASTATTLQTARLIGGVSFNGTSDITLPGVNTTGNQSTTGNAATATVLQTARTIALSGDVTGSVSFNGSTNVSITAVVTDDSHNHVISNVDGLRDALDSKANQATTYTKVEVDTALALKVDDTEIASVNLLRADKYLAAQNIANMLYTDGNLTKIQYTNATDVDYEVLSYSGGNLSTIQHYVGSVLKGTTTLSYTSGTLVSAIFVGV